MRIDPFDDEAVDAWWDLHAAAQRADRGPDALVWTREESRRALQQRAAPIERRAYLFLDDGAALASARLDLPQRDNTRLATVGVDVPPAHRRQGVGSAVLALLEREAAEAGRTVLHGDVSWPEAAGPDGTGVPGREFARRHGYALALGDVQSRLDLPLPETLLESLGAEAAAHTGAYALRSWAGTIPDELLEGWALLDAIVDTAAPTGALAIEAEVADPAEIRRTEELQAEQNRTSFGTVAQDAEGTVVAFTQLVVSGDDGNAYQWGTLVRDGHRGHRLGLAVKLANLRMLQREAPQVPAVYTFNAEVNAPMRDINARLGFVLSERLGQMQKRLP